MMTDHRALYSIAVAEIDRRTADWKSKIRATEHDEKRWRRMEAMTADMEHWHRLAWLLADMGGLQASYISRADRGSCEWPTNFQQWGALIRTLETTVNARLAACDRGEMDATSARQLAGLRNYIRLFFKNYVCTWRSIKLELQHQNEHLAA